MNINIDSINSETVPTYGDKLYRIYERTVITANIIICLTIIG